VPRLKTVYTERHLRAIALNLLKEGSIEFPQLCDKASAVYSWFFFSKL